MVVNIFRVIRVIVIIANVLLLLLGAVAFFFPEKIGGKPIKLNVFLVLEIFLILVLILLIMAKY